MGLELTFFGDDGFSPRASLMGVGDHDALMNAAEALQLSLLGRFSEYYEDVEIAVAEIPELLRELEILPLSIPLAPRQREVVREILKIAGAALAAKRSFIAIAD